MNDKLELKEIAPYFPWGLKCHWHDGNIGLLLQLGIVEKDNAYFGDGFDMVLTTDADFNKDSWMPAGNHQIKPLLRPLSDLTKTIIHKGEEFVPMMKMGYDKVVPDPIPNILSDVHKSMKLLPYFFVEQLHEWMFDTSDLIGRGLAIDINTLPENPYK